MNEVINKTKYLSQDEDKNSGMVSFGNPEICTDFGAWSFQVNKTSLS